MNQRAVIFDREDKQMSMPPTVSIPPAGTYKLDPAASSVSFATRHMFGLGGVTGSFKIRSGEIIIADPVTSSTATATIDAASFATGSAARDKDIKSRNFLHVQEHPEITFRSTELEESGEGWMLRGEITARGQAARADVALTELQTDAYGLTVRATCRVDRYAHGITKKKGMAGRYQDLDIAAHATRA
jgi:polyisoprenoid-binding protein YceI